MVVGHREKSLRRYFFQARWSAALGDGAGLSNAATTASGVALEQGSSWSLIYAGVTGPATDPRRNTPGQLVSITNSTPCNSYRLLVTSQRGLANSVQYADVQFYTTLVPEPATLTLAGVAVLGMIFFARRRLA